VIACFRLLYISLETASEWLASLHQATFEGDLEQMLVLIEQIPDEQLANALMSLANNLQYKEILNLTQPRDTE
jgi:hypothetical protein